MKILHTTIFVTGLSLSVCAAGAAGAYVATPAPVVVTPPPPVAVPAPPSLPYGYGRAKGALSGQKQEISTYYALNPDCSSAGKTIVLIKHVPEHGQVVVEDGPDYPSYDPPNVRSACDMKAVTVEKLYYTSRPGFIGMDEVDVEVIFPDGTFRTDRFAVNVRAAP